MKKTVALIIMIAVIISCFTGCENKTVAFDDFENLAISAALSYRTLVWNGSMDTDTPEFAWNTAGWYAAYKANLELCRRRRAVRGSAEGNSECHTER